VPPQARQLYGGIHDPPDVSSRRLKTRVDAFKRIKPELQAVVIEGATHSGARGAPGRPAFAAAVRDFLGAHRSTTTLH